MGWLEVWKQRKKRQRTPKYHATRSREILISLLSQVMGYPCKMEFCKAVDAFLTTVRIGDVTNTRVIQRSWSALRGAKSCWLHQIRLRTALWDRYQAQGKYDEAFRELREDGIVERGIAAITAATEDQEHFVQQHFPKGKDSAAYKYWQQCAMGALAYAYASFQEHQPEYEQRLDTVEAFLDHCLKQAGYACNGVRARLQYFRGIAHETNYEMDAAAAAYERAVNHFISRAERELADPSSPKYEIERSFVIYCLGKIELRLAQLDYERGRLSTATRE